MLLMFAALTARGCSNLFTSITSFNSHINFELGAIINPNIQMREFSTEK